jgi:hypothetical protein
MPPEPKAPAEPGFWQVVGAKLAAFAKWAARVLVAPGIALLLIVGAIVLVKPTKFVVTVKDTSGISAKHVDDLLKKYG